MDKAKGAVGLIISVIDLLAAVTHLPLLTTMTGVYACIAVSAIVVVWVIIGGATASGKLVRAVIIVAFIACVLGLIYNAGIAILVNFVSAPGSFGWEIAQANGTCKANREAGRGQIDGDCDLEFGRSADSAEVVVAPLDQYRAKVSRVTLFPSVPGGVIVSVEGRTDPREGALLVDEPRSGLKIPVKVRVEAGSGAASGTVELFASFHYFRKDLLWRVRTWLATKYG